METPKVDLNRYFLEYLMENKVLFIINFLLLISYPLYRITLPKYYGIIISSLNTQGSKNFINNVKIFIFIFILIQVLTTGNVYAHGLLIPRFSEFAIQRIFSNILNNKTINFENIEIGEILAKVTKLPYIVNKYLDLVRWFFFGQLAVYIVAMVHYFNTSKKVFLVFMTLFAALVILQFFVYNSTMDIEIKREREMDNIYQYFQDLLNNLISIIICKQEKYENQYLHKKFEPFIKTFFNSLSIYTIFRMIYGIFTVISFLLLNYLLYDEFQLSNITKKQFISSFIITYSILSLFHDTTYFTRFLLDLYSQVRDLEDYFNVTIDPSVQKTICEVPEENEKFSNGSIVFKNVSYQYEENKDFSGKYSYALKDINIEIKQNEHIAIIGQIGSGKSTLIKLLLKLFNPTHGEILINNVNLKNITRDDLYDHVFYIPQKPKLLNRSLYENIYYGLENTLGTREDNIEKIKNIMKKMKIEQNIIDTFMEKMDQPLGNEGIKLSGGQRQIVWIIRAMLRSPEIIIFDEPTSALDKKNKQNIIQVIKEVGKDKTILIISHDDIDPSFRKVILKQGELVEQSQQQSSFSSFFNWNNN